jgi:VWFA-related protein
VFTSVPRHKYNGALNVILMDGINTSFEHVADMRAHTLDFLRKLSRDEPVAIYGLNQKLELQQDFTTGVAPLESNAKASQPAATGGTFAPSKFREVPESESKVLRFMAWYPQPTQPCLTVQVTIKALHWIARSLAGYPGRKNLIWLSDRFPFGIYTELSQTTDTCLSRYTKELSETTETILDNEIAVYPVSAVGLENHDFDAAASAGAQGLEYGQTFANGVINTLQQQANLTVQINDLASKTGGQAFKRRNDLDMAIRSSIDDGSTYYTLGYYPADKNWNGAFRNIKVKVDRAGIELRHRSGYFATSGGPVIDRSPKNRGRSMSEALAPEVPTATSLLFEATFVPPSRAGNQALVKFAINPRGLMFDKPADQLEHASVDCVVKVYSLKGAIVKTGSSTLSAKLTPETFRNVIQGSFPCQQSLDLAPGTYLLRLGVIDNNTGVLGTAGGKITVF